MGSYLTAEIPDTPFLVNKQADWTLLLDRKQSDLSKNIKKLCFGVLKKLDISSLWRSFVAFILERKGVYVDRDSKIDNSKDCSPSVHTVLKKAIQRSRTQIRDNCQESAIITLTSCANIVGGKGKKVLNQTRVQLPRIRL